MADKLEAARQILRANDRGGFTVPTARLYPYQWNWDSAFTALGFATFDRPRAWAELTTLFDAQWPNGMVPHIIFRSNDPDYFPGPTVWQSGTDPASSGHSQPPVAASIVRELVRDGDDTDLQNARALFPRLMAYHRWFHQHRDPDNTGVVAIIHPWESGRDNCPDWDHAMDRITVPDDLGDYQRRDLSHVDADQRPSKQQYDRFLTIIKFGRENQWDSRTIYDQGPFLVADPGVQFILLRADRDLLELAEMFGNTAEAGELQSWISLADTATGTLWNESAGAFCAKDLRTGTFSNALTSASMLALYADTGTDTQKQIMLSHARSIMESVKYGFPSWDPAHADFESQRYWKGPVWCMMNHMIARGLDEQGEPEMAARIRSSIVQLIDNTGFFEYFDPLTGDGLGGSDFSWTAAMYLVSRLHGSARHS